MTIAGGFIEMEKMSNRTMALTDGVAMSEPSASRFDETVLCHLNLVYRVAVRMCGDVHSAEDLVQETFLKAHRGFAQFELREYGAKPWLLRILHNVYVSRGTRAHKPPTLLEDLSLEDLAADLYETSAAEVLSGKIDWERFDDELKAGVETLAPEYRSVLLLWALCDLSYKEIAEVLGCAIGTVMSRLFRARQQLGKALAPYAEKKGLKTGPGMNR